MAPVKKTDPVVAVVGAMIAPLPTDAKFFAEVARASVDPVVRCILMRHFLDGAMAELQADQLSPAMRKDYVRKIDRMWKAYDGHPEHWGQIARRLATAFDATAKIRESAGADAAKNFFARLLMTAYGPAVEKLGPDALEAVDVCATVWRRRAGAPSAKDSRPTKWAAFARVVEALGFGAIDADDLKKECSRGRVKNRRRARP